MQIARRLRRVAYVWHYLGQSQDLRGRGSRALNAPRTLCQPLCLPARCKKLKEAGAVRVRWPEDMTREVKEPETFSWHILQKPLWCAHAHMGWRYSCTRRNSAPEERRQRREAAEMPVAGVGFPGYIHICQSACIVHGREQQLAYGDPHRLEIIRYAFYARTRYFLSS